MFKNLSRVSFIFKRIFDCLLGFNFEDKFFFFKPWRLSLRIDLNEKIKFRDIIGKPRVRSDFSNMSNISIVFWIPNLKNTSLNEVRQVYN